MFNIRGECRRQQEKELSVYRKDSEIKEILSSPPFIYRNVLSVNIKKRRKEEGFKSHNLYHIQFFPDNPALNRLIDFLGKDNKSYIIKLYIIYKNKQ